MGTEISSLQERIKLLEGQKYLLLSAYEALKKVNEELKAENEELKFQLQQARELLNELTIPFADADCFEEEQK